MSPVQTQRASPRPCCATLWGDQQRPTDPTRAAGSRISIADRLINREDIMTRATLPALGDTDLVLAIDSLLLRLLTAGTGERDERPAALLTSLDSPGLQVALDAAGNCDSRYRHDIAALVAQALVSLSAGNLLEARRALIQARHLARGPVPGHRQASRAA